MNIDYTIKDTELSEKPRIHTVLPREINPESIRLQVDIERPKQKPLEKFSTFKALMFSEWVEDVEKIYTCDTQSTENVLLRPPSGILDAHFTKDERLVFITRSQFLYIIDMNNAKNYARFNTTNIAVNNVISAEDGCYLSSTEDGTIWITDKNVYYALRYQGKMNCEIYIMCQHIMRTSNVCQWGSAYLIGASKLTDRFKFHCAFITDNGTMVTRTLNNVRGIVKWKNKLLITNSQFCWHLATPVTFLSLHEWKGESTFAHIHTSEPIGPITSLNTEGSNVIAMCGYTGFSVLNESLESILRIDAPSPIFSACIHLGRTLCIADTSRVQCNDASEKGITGVIGHISDVGEGKVTIAPTKLVSYTREPIKMTTALGDSFLVTRDGIFTVGTTWSKRNHNRMQGRTRSSVRMLYALCVIGAIKVQPEILDIIAMYAFSS